MRLVDSILNDKIHGVFGGFFFFRATHWPSSTFFLKKKKDIEFQKSLEHVYIERKNIKNIDHIFKYHCYGILFYFFYFSDPLF